MKKIKIRNNGFSKISQFIYFALYALKSRILPSCKKPLICSFKITGRCNLKCGHCPFWKEDPLEEMGFERVCALLEELHNRGVRILVFEGGEPLLWKDNSLDKNIFDVIDYAKKLFFYTAVTTNGTLDLKNLQHFADIVFISIDGLKETHDSIRGKSFDAIIRNIAKYARTNKIIVNICVSKANYKDVTKLIKFLNDKVFGITVQFFYPYRNVMDLKISQKEKESILNELILLKKSGYKILDSYSCLKLMAHNKWKCYDFLVSSVEKTGNISMGCYLKNKVETVSCADCGFAVHCEISLAYRLNPSAIKAAVDIFWSKLK